MAIYNHIPICQIRVSKPVDTHRPEYEEFRDNIRRYGVTNPIMVSQPIEENGINYYIVVDGNYRVQAAKDVGWATIPCLIVPAQNLQEFCDRYQQDPEKIDLSQEVYDGKMERIW